MALKSESLLRASNEGINSDAIISGEDLEDGEIYDDEAEAEEKPEAANRLVEMEKAASAAPPEAQVPQPVAASAVVKSVLKNDALNMSDRHEKKIANFRWTDENSSKKEERNSGHLDADKRTKDKKLKRKKQKDDESENDGPAKFKGKTNVKKPFGEVSCELNHVHEEQYLCSPNLKKRKTSFERELEKLEDSDYIDEDDEEMLNIRGASPSRWMDIFSDEDDQSFEESEGGRGTAVRENVRGGAARRRGAGFRGGRIDRNARRERIERMSTRGGGGGKRRGKGAGMRGGKKGRVDEKEICIYHMQGKCHRGSECPFSHDAMPPRKMELCKFYLMDCCAKKDKCLYMHSEFPCKYFHTGLKCFAGKNCKFSHAKLTDSLRAILNKHLETAPKEILGDFPRLREATRNLKKDKKIPSLFDIKVSPPRDMRSQSDSDGNHTPMPSPTHQPNNKDFFRESMERERTPPQVAAAGGERRRGGEGGHHHKSGDRKSHSQRKDKETRRQERQERSEQRAAARLERAAERFEEGGMGGGGGGGRSSRERRGDKGGGRRHSWEDAELQQLQHHDAASQRGGDGGRRQESYSPPPHNYEEEAPINERLKAPEPDQSGNDFLSHLPKKQRELFLRIQQQQRQAENSQESNAEDDDQDNDCSKHEENWYSSDEESTPLTTILKTINIQKTATTSMMGSQAQSLSPNQNHHQPRHHHHHHHHHNHHHHNQQQQSHTQVSDEHQQPSSTPPSSSSPALPVAIPDIDFGDVSALLSKVQQHIQTTADRLKVRDPRLRPDDPTEKQQQHLASDHDHAHAEAHAHSRSSSLSEPHAQSRAPTQLSPSISAILNAAGRHQPHHHHNPHHSSPPSSHQHSSRSSHSHHHHHHHNNHSGAFPPATPVLNFDGDDDGDDDNGILSPDSETDPSPDADSMSLSRLPFKPAPVHSAANEIDASINSHAPIVYRLVPIQPSKPDYSALQTMPKGGALDPRWRKAVRFSEESGLGSRRDPRHRLAAAAPDDNPRHPSAASSSTSSSSSSSSASHPPADPRQRIMSSMMNSNNSNSSLLPPSTPRYDDDHTPTGMRAPGGGFPAQMDVSAAMFCPPTPRLDDDQQPIMAANNPSAPLRPTDPRQRHHMMNQQQAMTSHGNVYDHMRQQQQQMYPMPPNQQSMMFDPNHRGMYGNDMSANMNRQPQYNNYK